MMFCKNCGANIKEQVRFCPYCGTGQEVQMEKNVQEKLQDSQCANEKNISKKTMFLLASLTGVAVIMVGFAVGIFIRKGGVSSGRAGQTDQDVQESLSYVEDKYPVVLHAYSAVDVTTEGNNTVAGGMLQNLTASVREGEENQTGEVILTADTQTGELSTNLSTGVYTVQLHADGYLDIYVKIEVTGEAATKNVYVMPQLNEGQTGVVLTWEGEGTDLDLTLFTPHQAESEDMAHIGGRMKEDGHGNVLVSDNKSRCEAMYVNSGELGSYKLYVNDYTDSMAGNYTADTLSRLNVHIYIYNSNGFVGEYTLPSDQSGVVWEVAELNGSTVTPVQKMYSEVSGKKWWMEDKEVGGLVEENNRVARQAFYDVAVNGAAVGGDYGEKSSALQFLREIAAGTSSSNNHFMFLLKDIDGDGVEEFLFYDQQGDFNEVDDYDNNVGIIKINLVLKNEETGVEGIFIDEVEYSYGEFILNNNKVVHIYPISTYDTNWMPEGSSFKNIDADDRIYFGGQVYTVYDDWDVFSNRQEDKVNKEYQYIENTDLGREYFINERLVSKEEWQSGIQTDIINNLIPQDQFYEVSLENLQKVLLN